jgi:hypothetical protein
MSAKVTLQVGIFGITTSNRRKQSFCTPVYGKKVSPLPAYFAGGQCLSAFDAGGAFMFVRWLKSIILSVIKDQIGQVVVSLDPQKHYLLVLPDDLDAGEVANAFQPLAGKVNLLVLQAKGIKIIEVN